MMKKQAGQALILVLILLAIGTLMVVPALRLTGTSLKSSQIATRQTRALYAADAAQEYVMWKLLHQDWTDDFQSDGDVGYASIDVCGVSVNITVVMRAVEGEGGVTLATDDVIQPTKTVEHEYLPDPVPDKRWAYYTYTIKLEQLSSNTSQGLDAIYDIPPGGMTDYIGPTQLRVDGGPWLDVPDPLWDAAKGVLKWPLDYDKDTSEGAFSADPGDTDHYFAGIRDFDVRQVKELRFQMYGRLENNDTHCNWVVLKPWNTLSGPQAPIDVGNPDNPGECVNDQVLEVSKVSDPEVIMPGEATDIFYTISITNMYTQTRSIEQITDYLPPGFDYIGPTSNITDVDPVVSLETINGIGRNQLQWTNEQFPGGNDISIASGETLTLTFWAYATKDVSGSYYNEVIVMLKETGITQAFQEAGVLPGEYGSNYSWNTGTVIVPAYDSETEAEGVIIDANLAMTIGGITITSYQVR